MSASTSSARPEIVNRNGAPGHRLGVERQPLELGVEPFGRPVAAGAVARGLLVELRLQHRQVLRGVLRDGVIDDRLDRGSTGRAARRAERRTPRPAAESTGEPKQRRHGATRPRCVAGSHRGSQRSQASTAWLTWVSSERSTVSTVVPERAPRSGCRGIRPRRRARAHSSKGSSHGQRGRCARVRTRAMPPQAQIERRRRDHHPEPGRDDAPGGRRGRGEVGARRAPRRTTPRRCRRGRQTSAATAAPQNDGCGRRSHSPQRHRERRRREGGAQDAGDLPETRHGDDVLVEEQAHHRRARRSGARRTRRSRDRARRAGGRVRPDGSRASRSPTDG